MTPDARRPRRVRFFVFIGAGLVYRNQPTAEEEPSTLAQEAG